MILGGIPYYLDMLIKGQPVNRSIDDLFFREGAPLKEEFDFLFRSLFKESKIYRRVVETLADKMKGMSRQEILESLKLQEGGNLTEVLDNLVKCDFIRKYTHIGKEEKRCSVSTDWLFLILPSPICLHKQRSGREILEQYGRAVK